MALVNNEMITEALNGKPVYEILNAVWDEADSYYQKNVTRASLEGIRNTGSGINANPSLQNQFLSLLMTGVVHIAFSSPKLYDDFTEFRGKRIPYGKTLIETATDVIDPIEFDMYLSEYKEKEIFVPKVVTRYYVSNRQDQFPITVSKVQLLSAFDSEDEFMDFLRSIISTLYASNERAKYQYTILTLEEYYKQNRFYLLEAPNILSGTTDDTENFIEQVERLTLELGLGDGSREYNNQGLVDRTSAEDLYLFVTPAMLARFKIKVWAKVFNLTEAEFKPNVKVIRGFPNAPEIQAILCDREFFRIHPNFESIEEAVNRRGLYSTFYLNCFDTYGLSDFKNAIAIVDKKAEKAFYDVVIPVSNCDIRRGASIPFDGFARQVESISGSEPLPYTLVWTVEKMDGGSNALSANTKFDGNVLTVGEDESNSMLQIKATLTATDTSDVEYTIVGRSSAKVVK